MNLFLWVIYPYLTLAIMILGSFYRYQTDPLSWTAKSSQMLEGRRLRLASTVFHWGIILAFFGHVVGLVIPVGFYRFMRVPDDFYHLTSVTAGGIAGVAALYGLLLLTYRRLEERRILRYSDRSDYLSLVLLLLAVGLGVFISVGWQNFYGPYEYRTTVGVWFRSLLSLHPNPALMANVPFVIQFHVIIGFAVFAIVPFTRLIHIWSLPLIYLNRAPIQYRRRTPIVGRPQTGRGRQE